MSVPCQELFEKQTNEYKRKILDETTYKISIEAATTNNWKKFVGEKGLSFGINNFGKSAPYKDIYNFFGLTVDNIFKKVKAFINR